MISAGTAAVILAAWETVIGLGLLLGVWLRATLALLWLQMLGTVMPLFLLPDACFTLVPYAPSLEGQYIVKNVVLISAGIVIGATVPGGRLRAEADPVGADDGVAAAPPKQ